MKGWYVDYDYLGRMALCCDGFDLEGKFTTWSSGYSFPHIGKTATTGFIIKGTKFDRAWFRTKIKRLKRDILCHPGGDVLGSYSPTGIIYAQVKPTTGEFKFEKGQ